MMTNRRIQEKSPASRPDLHVFGEIYADLGVPQYSSLGPSLDRAEYSDISIASGLLSFLSYHGKRTAI